MIRSTGNRISGENPSDDPEIERTYAILKKDISPIVTTVTQAGYISTPNPKKSILK